LQPLNREIVGNPAAFQALKPPVMLRTFLLPIFFLTPRQTPEIAAVPSIVVSFRKKTGHNQIEGD
jgi:hypothetical protein